MHENVLLIYDIKRIDNKEYFRVKRLFYYYLKKYNPKTLTKSAIIMQEQDAKNFVDLLKQKNLLHYIKLFSIKTKSIEEIE